MHQFAQILVVPKEHLNSTPEAFQKYVEDYFAEQKIFGIPCMAAFRVLSRNHHRRSPGVAPGHSVDLMHYKEGLNGKDLGEWIRDAAKKGLLWQFYASWDDGCIGSLLDD